MKVYTFKVNKEFCMKVLLISVLSFLIVSCATPYQPKGSSGGYSNMGLGNDQFKISFKGNVYTDSDTVYDYFLRRCAEVTVEKGFDYFVLMDNNVSSETNVHTTTTGSANTTGNNEVNHTSKTETRTSTEYLHKGIIKVFKSGSQPQTSFEAREILKNFKDK
jgi:hypothetical protein